MVYFDTFELISDQTVWLKSGTILCVKQFLTQVSSFGLPIPHTIIMHIIWHAILILSNNQNSVAA